MPQGPSLKQMLGAFAAIGVCVGGSAAAFAYTAGWLTSNRLTPERVVDALGHRGGDPVGHRRNHSNSVCFTGTLESNGASARLSTARVLAPGSYKVTGRFATAVGNPAAPDSAGRVRSMAIRVTMPDGQEWRSGMNNSPVFVVATPQAFYDATLASAVDPAIGTPDLQASALRGCPSGDGCLQSMGKNRNPGRRASPTRATTASTHSAWSMQATMPTQPTAQA